MKLRSRIFLMGLCGASAPAVGQQTSVVSSPHNLSVTGPGQTRAVAEAQVCIFCHAPHNAAPIRPLWNRSMPLSAFSIYRSPSLDANPGQPTGTSKMCLSCHDGTIALGAVFSRDTPITMTGGQQTITAGRSHIGTDLSDDHPISFQFDSSLAARDPKLKPPSSLPMEVRLDANQELQCTSCHDAHNNFFGDFLVMDNTQSALCTSCHSLGTTPITAHGQCVACHQNHTSPSGPYLLREATVTDTCLRCHDGSDREAQNILDELRKFSVHDTQSPVDPPDPQEEHTSCTSCHDPHTMRSGTSRAPAIQPSLGTIAGVNASGSPITAATFEFEVCFKCHGPRDPARPLVSRQIVQTNLREEFSPSAVSFHPVETAGKNPDVPSLLPPWTAGSIMHCSECHSSRVDSAFSNSDPNSPFGSRGPHGSNYPGLLNGRYETSDDTSESAAAYQLCYRCHDRNSILDEVASSFPLHRKHILDERTPCSACHDPHGVPSTLGTPMNNSHLMNFDTRIVLPNSLGRLEYRDLGRFAGTCSLRCHGAEHDNFGYGGVP